jgi:hypothetical protein
MTRPLALVLLVLAVPVVAAPVPKSVKSKVPDVRGTKWLGELSDPDMSPVEYTFHEDGKLTWHYPKRKQTFTDATWQQTGDTITHRVDDGYAWTTATYKDGGFEGTGTNVRGVTWTEKLTPAEKK